MQMERRMVKIQGTREGREGCSLSFKLPNVPYRLDSLEFSMDVNMSPGLRIVPYDLPDECDGMNVEQVEAYVKAHNLKRYDNLAELFIKDIQLDLAGFEQKINLGKPKSMQMMVEEALYKQSTKRGCLLYTKSKRKHSKK